MLSLAQFQFKDCCHGINISVGTFVTNELSADDKIVEVKDQTAWCSLLSIYVTVRQLSLPQGKVINKL